MNGDLDFLQGRFGEIHLHNSAFAERGINSTLHGFETLHRNEHWNTVWTFAGWIGLGVDDG